MPARIEESFDASLAGNRGTAKSFSWLKSPLYSRDRLGIPGARVEDEYVAIEQRLRPRLVGGKSDTGAAERIAEIASIAERVQDVPLIHAHAEEHGHSLIDWQAC